MKLEPGTTTKSLPWLDGKLSPVARVSPPARAISAAVTTASDGAIESPPRTPPSSKTGPESSFQRSSTGRSAWSAPTNRPNSLKSPVERRISSAGANGTSATQRKLSLAPHQPSTKALGGRSLSPKPVQLGVQRNVDIASPIVMIESGYISPTQPIPKRSPFESARGRRRLSNAIEELEDLVDEAVVLSEQNANQVQAQEIYEIIEDATIAIQQASTLSPPQHLMVTTSPLEVSGSSEEVSEFSDGHDTKHHATTNPIKHGRIVRISENTPEHESRGPEGIDWACKQNQLRGRSFTSISSSASSNDSIDHCGSKYSTRSDLLLPPEQAQTSSRKRVDVVMRPARLRPYSRGRSRQRKVSQSDIDTRQNRHRPFRRSPVDHSRYRKCMHRRESLCSSSTSLDDDEEIFRPLHHYPDKKQYRQELTMRDQIHHRTLSLGRFHRRQPIARNWSTKKKRITAIIACINTSLLGIIVGIYAGEVPRIQYMLADERHIVIVGNVVLYTGLAISTFISWPLPLLHGRKPYILAALALALPLQFPQALVVGSRRSPKCPQYRTGLLVARFFTGLVLGFANVNFITALLDCFGASLQSKNPHQEYVVVDDIRRHGGGMGIWLGIWSWSAIASLAIGFQIGAGIIETLTPDWGFYVVVILLAAGLVLNILAPETRRSAYRRSVTELYNRDMNFITRRVARGEVKLHIGIEGPKYWFEEVWAGMKLTMMMCFQPGFAVLAFYLGWIYAQIVLVIVLLGSLLSRDYKWRPRYVGAGVMSIAIGALLAIPLTKAGIFSRERKNPFRTDSMTFQKQVTWSSHLVRRVIFTMALPLMGLAYTVSSAGRPKPYMVPICFAGAVGFMSILAIAECHGLIMETFDTCDLQPGVNTRHRLKSIAVQDKRRRTNYSSFPRVTAGIMASQALAFIGAAIATEVGGIMTRRIGAQASTGVTAGILLGLTILLTAVLWRWKEVQVIPNHTFGTRRDTKAWEDFKNLGKSDWKAVVIGNPSGKTRRMSVLELGGMSRWTEIRKLNFLIRDSKQDKTSSWRF